MANTEHLKAIKKGVEFWNNWRAENLIKTINLRGANLQGVNLAGVNLREAQLRSALLSNADLSGADLRGAKLFRTNLFHANLSGADLRGADLSKAELTFSNLYGADLSGADLVMTVLSSANLVRANLSHARCSLTVFSGINFSEVHGLETVEHLAPSYVDVRALYRLQGRIPIEFLRGCGIPEKLIAFLPALLENVGQFYSCFISYSHADKDFAKLLYDRLQGEGIECWLDEHQLNPGDKLHLTIYDAIRVYDKVVLCCSENALTSWWVEKEFETAIGKEEDYGENVLIPINLDGYLFGRSKKNWVADEIKKRFVSDFTYWKVHDEFEKGFQTVVKSLRTDGGKPPPPEPKLKPK